MFGLFCSTVRGTKLLCDKQLSQVLLAIRCVEAVCMEERKERDFVIQQEN